MRDTVSEFIINLKNSSNAGKSFVSVPYSKMRMAIAEVLVKEGYIKSAVKRGKKAQKSLDVEIIQNGNNPKIGSIVRVSKPSKRIYMGVKEIRPVKYGYGLSVLSTPKGILTDKEARKENVGGEVLFKIW